jgi:hypothetical protein
MSRARAVYEKGASEGPLLGIGEWLDRSWC